VAITKSPDNPVFGDRIIFYVTNTVTSLESPEPVVTITSAPPESTIQPGTRLSVIGAPSGEVISDPDNAVDGVAGSPVEADNYWSGATLTFTSGRNAGQSRVIGQNENSSRFPLSPPLPRTPEVGDRFALSLPAGDRRARLSFVPDVPGEYVITAHATTRAIAPTSFGGDSVGDPTLILGAAQTLTVHVSELLDLPIVPENGHGVTLRLKVSDETVRAAALVRPLTPVALAATLDSGVISALGVLVGETVAGVGNDLQATANNLRAKYELHRIRTASSTHASADSVNTTLADDAYDDTSAIRLVNRLRTVIYGHLTGASAAGARWHTEDDTKNVPMIAPAKTKAEATVLLADLAYRVYPGHLAQIASPASHGAADATNTITVTKEPLSELVRVYLNFIAQSNPTVPAGLPEGAIDARTRYGFRAAT